MQWDKDTFIVSDDSALLDPAVVWGLLKETYWAAGRTLETVRKSLQHSLNFGLYDGRRPIGFARVVTDYATHGYICDVVIAPEYQGRGLGTWLLRCLLAHPELQSARLDLFTKDAQSFYRQFGFRPHRFDCLVRYPPNYAGGSDWPKENPSEGGDPL